MDIIQTILIGAVPVLFAITLHEVAHGWVARQLGDSTAHALGRLSVNPIKHIDPIGTVILPILLIITTGFGFGWAKPVPVNFGNLNHPKQDMVWVALAGPAANLIMLVFWALVMKAVYIFGDTSSGLTAVMVLMCYIGIVVNLILMLINLIPIPPLDGGRVLTGLVPIQFSKLLMKIEPFGMFIAFGLLLYLFKNNILQEPLNSIYSMLSNLFGIPI